MIAVGIIVVIVSWLLLSLILIMIMIIENDNSNFLEVICAIKSIEIVINGFLMTYTVVCIYSGLSQY